jgi:hypothetical protein
VVRGQKGDIEKDTWRITLSDRRILQLQLCFNSNVTSITSTTSPLCNFC